MPPAVYIIGLAALSCAWTAAASSALYWAILGVSVFAFSARQLRLDGPLDVRLVAKAPRLPASAVVLGLVGGLGLVIGPAGLFVERRRRDPALSDPAQHGLDESFITLLLVTSATGLLLLAFREQRAVMAGLLIAHLGSVLALFATLPYGKFVHGIYRTAALVKYAAERARDEQTTGAAAPQGAIVRNEPRIPAPAEAAPALPGE